MNDIVILSDHRTGMIQTIKPETRRVIVAVTGERQVRDLPWEFFFKRGPVHLPGGRSRSRRQVGTARCAVTRAPFRASLPDSNRPLVRGREHRGAMSLPTDSPPLSECTVRSRMPK
ncbi:MAG TPA: hypothetical protein VNT99_08300 [Methylomirabilota bacterium]|nr:hypothetical protein [Methylomirabilota bacterium]